MSEDSNSLRPDIKWSQRKDSLLIRVDVQDSHDSNIDLQPDSVTFKASGGTDDDSYYFKLEFFKPIDVKESTFAVRPRETVLHLKKAEEGPHWPRITQEKVKYTWIQTDWANYMDEDDEDESENAGFGDGQMDWSQFGGQGGMPPMGGMGMPGAGGMPPMGGMGMPGMGGMGMPGMGGMPGAPGAGNPMAGMDPAMLQQMLASMGGMGAGAGAGAPDLSALGNLGNLAATAGADAASQGSVPEYSDDEDDDMPE